MSDYRCDQCGKTAKGVVIQRPSLTRKRLEDQSAYFNEISYWFGRPDGWLVSGKRYVCSEACALVYDADTEPAGTSSVQRDAYRNYVASHGRVYATQATVWEVQDRARRKQARKGGLLGLLIASQIDRYIGPEDFCPRCAELDPCYSDSKPGWKKHKCRHPRRKPGPRITAEDFCPRCAAFMLRDHEKECPGKPPQPWYGKSAEEVLRK